MIWGDFCDIRRSKFYIMDRDFESRKFEYNINFYFKILNRKLAFI